MIETKNSRPTQCDRVLQYMKDFGSIDTRQAMLDLGVYRLASRISEMKRKGIAISTRTVTGKNRYGEVTHFAEYTLA